VRALGLAGVSALAADSHAPVSPGEGLLDDGGLESGGVVIHVVIEPLAACVSSCADELPVTGGVLPSDAGWIAVALLATGLALVLRRRGRPSLARGRRPWQRAYPYDVVSGRRAGSARVEFDVPGITCTPPAGDSDRDSERGDP
jgi:hypothetical protein